MADQFYADNLLKAVIVAWQGRQVQRRVSLASICSHRLNARCRCWKRPPNDATSGGK
jgi:hypothetical protein